MALIRVLVQPRASRTEVVGRHGDAIRIRVKSPPVDGAANAELVRFIAKTLAIPRSAVTLKTGTSGKRKTVEIAGLDSADVERMLTGGRGVS